MNQRDTALASLRGRTYRASITPDPRTLLDEAALDDALKLTGATDLVTDIPAAHALGWFHWLRYLAVPGQDASEELTTALHLLKPVFERNPYAVPEPVQRWYLQTEACLYTDSYRQGPTDRTGFHPERSQAPERLPVFHATVRSTIDAAPASEPERTRFLLNAALMLRRIARSRGADDAVLAEAAEVTLAALGTGQAIMSSGWPHTQADQGRLPANQRQVPFGPDLSWPTGYSNLEYRDGDYRYPASYTPQPPANHGEHPYAAFSGPGYGAEGGGDAGPSAADHGYGDRGYSDPGYDGPASQDAAIAGTRTVRGVVESSQAASRYAQRGYELSRPAAQDYGYNEADYAAWTYVEPAYPLPSADAYPAVQGYQQPWDYEQPLRYDGEEQSYPAPDSCQQSAAYHDTNGYGSGGYNAQAYDPSDYNGSQLSRPGIDSPGYDLSGIIGTGAFEAFEYDEPSYGRLSYDDPRYDGSRSGGPRPDQTQTDMRALGPAPRSDTARLDNSGFSAFGVPNSGPRFDETRMDMRALGSARPDETRFDVPEEPGPTRAAFARAAERPNSTEQAERIDGLTASGYPDLRTIGRESLPGGPRMPGGSDVPESPSPSEPVRHLWAHLPERVGVGQRIPLLVWVSMTGGAGASAPLEPFAVPNEGRRIVVAASAPGFELLTDADQELLVPASGDSKPIRFGLRAMTPGLHHVRADAFASGTFLGRVELQVSAEVGAALTDGVPRRIELPSVSGHHGEITLQVNRENDAYSFQLTGTSWYQRVLTRSLAGDPSTVVEQILGELRAIARGESGFTSSHAIREHLKNLGTKLWSDIVPDSVRRQFWEQAGNIRSFVVMSNLDMVPWELLHAVDQGRPEVGFLAEHVPVVRRVYERMPAYRLPLPSSAYVVPPESPSDALDEVGDVRAVIGHRVRDLGIVSRLDDLHDLFGAPPGLLHFACHNTFSPTTGSEVRMDGGPIRPDDLEQCKRRLSMVDASPLVFFNACRTAGEIYGFTQMSGWASQFMAAGAGAFIGTLWPVRSETARMFAKSFYEAIVHKGLPLGDASLVARRSVAQDLEDPTWLAYTIYGSPGARVAS